MHIDGPPISTHSQPDIPPGGSIDIGAWIGYFWEKKWIFILGALAFGAIGTVLSFTLTKMFTATATVLVRDAPQVIPNQLETAKDIYAAPEALKAMEGAFKSDSLLLAIVKANHLDLIHPAFQAKPSDPPMNDAKLVELMGYRYSAKAQRGSRLIDIEVSDEDPALAQKLAQSAVDEYVKLICRSSADVVATANAQLAKQAAEIQQRLEKSEQELQGYRERYHTTSIQESKDLSLEKLKQLNQQLTDAKSNRIRLESELNGLADVDLAPLGRLLAIQSIASEQDIGQLQKSLADAEMQLAQAKKEYGPRHPQYESAAGAVQAIRVSLERLVRNYARALVNECNSAREAEANLKQQVANEDRAAVELSGIAIPYAVLERREEADRSTYDQLLERMRANNVQENVHQLDIQQVGYPILPNVNEPSKPKAWLVITVAVVAGLGFAFLYAFLSRATDTSLRSIEEAENILPLPMLAAIPAIEAKKVRKRRKGALLQVEDPASPQAEAFRGLRAALALSPDGQPRSVVFTSSVPEEGKSLCAANYAVALSQQGLQTLLVEADLRRPSLADMFPILPGGCGLADNLLGIATQQQSCFPTQIPNLAIMPAGRRQSKPAEILARHGGFQTLLQSLTSYDCVVIDSAPILAASDSLLIAPVVQAVVLVVRARKTRRKDLGRALRFLNQSGVSLAGFVLNRVPRQETYQYTAYANDYASGTGWGVERSAEQNDEGCVFQADNSQGK